MTEQQPINKLMANRQQSAAIPINTVNNNANNAPNNNPNKVAARVNNTSKNAILSVDLGRTSTKTCVTRNPDNVVFIPSNVKHLTMGQVRGGSFESSNTDPLMDLWIEYRGMGYALGQLAEDFGANLGVGQSKVEDALAKVLACAGYFGLKDDISIVLGLPYHSQEQFGREKEQITNLLTGSHKLKYRGEDLSLNVTKVWVMPEGYGSLLWCEVSDTKLKTEEGKDLTKNSVAIVDIGHQTTDFLIVDSFRLARGISQSQAFAMSQFYDRVASEVKSATGIEGAHSQSLTLISAVHKPKGSRLYRPKGAAKPCNLDDFLPNLKEQFSREICQRLLDWLPERATGGIVILTGGGGEFFWEDVERLITEAGNIPYLAKPSRQANALGQYIYGEVQVAAAPVRSTKA